MQRLMSIRVQRWTTHTRSPMVGVCRSCWSFEMCWDVLGLRFFSNLTPNLKIFQCIFPVLPCSVPFLELRLDRWGGLQRPRHWRRCDCGVVLCHELPGETPHAVPCWRLHVVPVPRLSTHGFHGRGQLLRELLNPTGEVTALWVGAVHLPRSIRLQEVNT